MRCDNDIAVDGLASDLNYPDGLSDDHAEKRGGFTAHASLVSIIVLGALMLLAMTGLLAGARTPVRDVGLPQARLSVQVPETLRNGEFFEMRVIVTANTDLTDATIALPPSLWRDMTINTVIPGASEEEHKDGQFRYRYGALKAGDTLEVKIDGQINPPLTLGTSGAVALYDGERRLGALPVTIRVLP